MKVLMFGWEFPPHISGGLGTACYGLTLALRKNKVKVLFAIPKLYGDEGNGHLKFIDVSSVSRRNISARSNGVHMKPHNPPQPIESRDMEQSTYSVSYIDVPVALKPYLSADTMAGQSQQCVTTWNYTFNHLHPQEQPGESGAVATATTLPENEAQEALAHLSGTYGPNLMDEVHRYADAADKIAMQHTFDVIHAHDWMTFLAAIAAKKVGKTPGDPYPLYGI